MEQDRERRREAVDGRSDGPSGGEAEPRGGQESVEPPRRSRRSAGEVGGGGGGAALAGAGIQFAISILLFLYVGQWLDRRLGWAPWGTLVGVFIGAAAGFTSIYRRLMGDLRREEEAKRRQ